MIRSLILCLVLSTLCFAQEKAPEPPAKPGDVVRVIPIRQGDVEGIYNVIRQVVPPGAVVTRDTSRQVLIVRGSPEVADVLEQAVKKLDVAASSAATLPDVELTVHLLYGSVQAASAGTIPPDLEGTVKQLRNLFPYKGYRVMDTWVLRSKPGANKASAEQVQSMGTLPGTQIEYSFRYTPTLLAGPSPRSVDVTIQLYLRMPVERGNQTQFTEARINTDLQIREGQKTVVGKSNIAGTEDAVILVVSPKIIE